MRKPTITALIIARDAERHLSGCLHSLRWVDEIVVVVDAASRDETEAIARARADTVILRQFDDFSAQRNAGLAAARSDWVLALDADERVPEKLVHEIANAMRDAPSDVGGYRIPIASSIFGRRFVASGTQLDRPLRLFRRTRGRWVGPVHETVELDGPVRLLQTPIEHRTHETMSVFLAKLNAYTTLEARRAFQRGERPRPFDLTLRPLATFLRLYVVRAGFRDGPEGFAFCLLSGVSTLVKSWKLKELAKPDRAIAGPHTLRKTRKKTLPGGPQ